MRVQPYGKAVSRTVRADQSVMFRVKCVGKYDSAGVAITACTATQAADTLTVTTNAAVDTDIAVGGLVTYATVASIQAAIDLLNGITAAVTNTRYRASTGDYRPGYVIGAGDGLVVGAANILLGQDTDGFDVLADVSGHAVANLLAASIGGPTGKRGSDPFLPDHFESDYTSTTAGVITPVRSQGRRREEQNSSLMQTMITSIHCGATFANSDNVLSVYDSKNNLIWQHTLGAGTDVPANVLSEEHPIVGPMGSPLFVEAAGTGALTDGPLTVRGYKAVA